LAAANPRLPPVTVAEDPIRNDVVALSPEARMLLAIADMLAEDRGDPAQLPSQALHVVA